MPKVCKRGRSEGEYTKPHPFTFFHTRVQLQCMYKDVGMGLWPGTTNDPDFKYYSGKTKSKKDSSYNYTNDCLVHKSQVVSNH